METGRIRDDLVPTNLQEEGEICRGDRRPDKSGKDKGEGLKNQGFRVLDLGSSVWHLVSGIRYLESSTPDSLSPSSQPVRDQIIQDLASTE